MLDALVIAPHPDDAELQNALKELDSNVTEQLVETYLHMASLYVVRTDYRNALASVNKAIALAPKNREAWAMRARIESATYERDDDYWRGSRWWRRGFYRFGWRRYGHVGWSRISRGGHRLVVRSGSGLRGGRAR